jgi:hypothetical protein
MSPLPLENVVDALARVHVPLTVSETSTWPAESYWPNQPASRWPAWTGPDSVIVVVVTRVPVDAAQAWFF